LVSMIPLVENFHNNLTLFIALILVTLPLLEFTSMKLTLNKKLIRKIIKYHAPKPNTTTENGATCMGDIGIVVDDSMRQNATVVDM